MFNEQRALFQGAFDAQAANLAGTVGSATVVSQVADSRFIVDETQTAAGYTEAIEPLPNCGAASAVDQASCEAIRGCAYGACTSSPLLSTRRMRWVSLLASFATCISAFASCNSPWLHHMHSTHSGALCYFWCCSLEHLHSACCCVPGVHPVWQPPHWRSRGPRERV